MNDASNMYERTHIPRQVTGVILAGGQARRMGGIDKGLIKVHNRALIEYIIQAFAPQVHNVLISANRNFDQYKKYGYNINADILPGHLGPLTGMLSALLAADTEYILTVPCDCPFVAANYAQRMWRCHLEEQVPVCIAHDGNRLQPMFTLLHHELASNLETYLTSGHRKAKPWLLQRKHALVDFSDFSEMFFNVNTPEDLTVLENNLSQW
jgi:molybdenum cofactor guanylyltransferase